MANKHDFDITTHAGFASSIFSRRASFKKYPFYRLECPLQRFLTDIETQITKNTKTQKIRHHSKFCNIDFQHKKTNFD